jgi:predicted GIY-YIG superfamily endonuclease
MQFWTYILRCSDGSYYAGHTDQLEARLWQHHQGLGCDWTRGRQPVELVWCADAPTRDEAFAFERRIKCWTRAKKEALIESDWDRISWLSKPPSERTGAHPNLARPERSEAKSKRAETTVGQRPSTSLRTSEVESCVDSAGTELRAKPEAEGRGKP